MSMKPDQAYLSVVALEALIKEKQDLEANLEFLNKQDLVVRIFTPNGNQYLQLPETEMEEILYEVIRRRKQRLDDINAIFKEIDKRLLGGNV